MSNDWSGKYEETYESKESLEKDIERAMEGRYVYPTEDGGTIRESDSRIDVYDSSDSSKGHSHDWYDIDEGNGHHD